MPLVTLNDLFSDSRPGRRNRHDQSASAAKTLITLATLSTWKDIEWLARVTKLPVQEFSM